MIDASLIEAGERILERIHTIPEMEAYYYDDVHAFEQALEKARARSGLCKDCLGWRTWRRTGNSSWCLIYHTNADFGCVRWRPREEKAEWT